MPSKPNDSLSTPSPCRVLINLTYSKGANVRSRVERLQQLGLDNHLRKLTNDPCLDVQVNLALLFSVVHLKKALPSIAAASTIDCE